MAGYAETHIDFDYRTHPIHRLNRAMAGLALNAGMNMRHVPETNKIRKRVDPIPANLKRRSRAIDPRLAHRPQRYLLSDAGVTPLASLDRWHSRVLGPASVLVTILARDLMQPGMNLVTERDRLNNVLKRSPRTLGKERGGDPEAQNKQGNYDCPDSWSHVRGALLRLAFDDWYGRSANPASIRQGRRLGAVLVQPLLQLGQ